MIIKFAIVLVVSLMLSGCLPSIARRGASEREVKAGEFAKGKAVAGFPNLPRYPEAQIIESIARENSFGASFITKDNFDKVLTFYNDALPQLGWDTQFVKNSDTNYLFKVKNSQYEGTIIVNVAADGRSTAMTYSISTR